ncbi:MAG TPA: ribonuclease P protein component [Alphaproteobacteria bacterium]|nr:ribonuclease P protein component [Alphaproteobacteria bacterium]
MAAATGHSRTVGRLKKRSEFLAVAAGNRRCAMPGLVVQALALPPEASPSIRVGFTATKKIGNAVARNRARRRLRAAAHEVLRRGDGEPRPSDLVLVARQGTIERPYGELLTDLRRALKRLEVLAP